MIPKSAKIVFKGVMFDVYHWKQKMFDGSYTTFEGIKRRPSVQLIVVVGDKLLLQKEEQPHVGKFLALPGGVIDDDEKVLIAAKRELLEETGMVAKKMKFWRKTNFSKKIEWQTYYFVARDCKKIQEPHLDIGEKIEAFVVSFEEFIDIVSDESFRNRDFADYVFRIKQDKQKFEEFKKLIFG